MDFAAIMLFLEAGADLPAHLAGGGSRKASTLGPNELRGDLATPQAGHFDLSFEPEHQRWTPVGRGVWIGVDRRGTWTPDDFARSETRSGHKVKLGDGKAWEIPVARLALGGSGLPRRRVLTDDGKKVWEVEEQYRALSEFADRAWSFHAGLPVVITQEETDEACGRALAVNYRMGETEAIALGLFTDTAVREIVLALIDYPTLLAAMEAQKKRPEPAGS